MNNNCNHLKYKNNFMEMKICIDPKCLYRCKLICNNC